MVSLTRDQVNSWRLTKHHLVQRAQKGEIERVVSELCGVQAQVLSGAALALWARVRDITFEDVKDALWKRRSLVKTWCMRGTLHLVSSTDLPTYVAALKTTQVIKTDWLTPEIGVDERKKITSTIRDALDNRTLTRQQLAEEVVRRLGLSSKTRAHMVSGWGNLLQPAAQQGSLCFGPNEGSQVTFVRPDQWIGKWNEPGGPRAWKTILRRFFETYGPANHHDLGHWWALRPDKARTVIQHIVDDLAEVDFEGEKKWVLRKDLERIVDAEKIESVKLLPSWDGYVMFYHPRELFISKSNRERVFSQLRGNRPVLLINGVAGGIWEQKRKRGGIEIQVQPFEHLSSSQKDLIKEETASLGEFLGTNVTVTTLRP